MAPPTYESMLADLRTGLTVNLTREASVIDRVAVDEAELEAQAIATAGSE